LLLADKYNIDILIHHILAVYSFPLDSGTARHTHRVSFSLNQHMFSSWPDKYNTHQLERILAEKCNSRGMFRIDNPDRIGELSPAFCCIPSTTGQNHPAFSVCTCLLTARTFGYIHLRNLSPYLRTFSFSCGRCNIPPLGHIPAENCNSRGTFPPDSPDHIAVWSSASDTPNTRHRIHLGSFERICRLVECSRCSCNLHRRSCPYLRRSVFSSGSDNNFLRRERILDYCCRKSAYKRLGLFLEDIRAVWEHI